MLSHIFRRSSLRIVPWPSDALAGTHIVLRVPQLRDGSGRQSARSSASWLRGQAWTCYDNEHVSNPIEFARFLANRVVDGG